MYFLAKSLYIFLWIKKCSILSEIRKYIAEGIIHQKDISYEGLKKMQKKYKVHRDIGVIERHYLKSPVEV